MWYYEYSILEVINDWYDLSQNKLIIETVEVDKISYITTKEKENDIEIDEDDTYITDVNNVLNDKSNIEMDALVNN